MGFGVIRQGVIALVIDDDEVDMMSIERALSRLHVSNAIKYASDGLQALDILKGDDDLQGRPYVIFLDLNMPRMNGFEFLEIIRSEDSYKDAPVFVLTTSESDDDIRKSFDYDVMGYIFKSDLEGSLREAITYLDHDLTIMGHA